jgi:hypothetical protein
VWQSLPGGSVSAFNAAGVGGFAVRVSPGHDRLKRRRLDRAAAQAGLKAFTAAFVIGSGLHADPW